MGENLHDWLVAEQVASAAAEAERNARDPEQIRARKQAQYRSKFKDRKGDESLPGSRVKTKPAVPKRSDAPPARGQPQKNFIMVNAITNILSGEFPKGRKEEPKLYVNKPEYGKAPKYLQRVKAEIVKEDEEINAHTLAASAAAASEAARFRPMPEEERLRLVDELKAKWDDLNSQYQRMAHMVVMDTAGKVQRKERLDKELRKIEAAIDKLDKPVIIHEK